MTERHDTSRLGPIRIDASERATRARVVRQALELLGLDTANILEASALFDLARLGTDDTLIRLGRMLK